MLVEGGIRGEIGSAGDVAAVPRIAFFNYSASKEAVIFDQVPEERDNWRVRFGADPRSRVEDRTPEGDCTTWIIRPRPRARRPARG